MSDKNIHSGHRERLRSRFLSTGILGFSEHELLELMLFYVIPRSDTNELAHSLLVRFGNLSSILNADASELSQVRGMGEAAASFIKLIDSITRSVGSLTLEQIVSDPTEYICSDLIRRSKGITEDSFTIYYINSRSAVTDTCIFSENDFISGALPPRRIVETAVVLDAPSVKVGICHRNSLPFPTKMDYSLLKKLTELLTRIDIIIDDALIAGNNSCFSLRDDGSFNF